MDDWGFETRAIHSGQPPEPDTGAVVTPIYQTSTYAQEAVGRHRGYEYARTANPTRAALEACMGDLEGGQGLAFASGMAASDAVLRLLRPGDHVVISQDSYGGTVRLLERVHAPAGIPSTAVDLTDAGRLEAAWPEHTRMVWVESPTNPTLAVVDVAAVAGVAHRREALVVVDNTFATPWLQRPLDLGADIVVHSTTKYLAGHSDVVGGLVVVANGDLHDRIALVQRTAGAVPGPFDCFLVLRGVKTLAVRMDRHCANAGAVAEMLARHPAVARVLYPGLAAHPGRDLAARQMRDFGGMVSFVAAGGERAALDIVARTQVFTLAESLGGVESLIGYPARMSHAGLAGTGRAVDPALVRLSVGIESVDDLLTDLTVALDAVS